MSRDTIKICYRFKLDENKEEIFDLEFDSDNFELISDNDEELPD